MAKEKRNGGCGTWLLIILILGLLGSCGDNSNEEKEKTAEDYASYEEYVDSKKIVSEETINLEEEIENSIFYGEIGLNKSYYDGKNVTFSICCGYGEEEMEEITTDSNLCYGSIKVIFKEPQHITNGEFITVNGVVGEKYSATSLLDANIICRGEQAKENYDRELENFHQSFLNAETVLYDDLLRYPDTYKDKKIKLDVNITDVESDGIVFNGTITGVIPGTDNEIAIYDYRENREPRIQENDKLTIYCVGNKTITVKLKNGSGIFSETVDEYEIPSVYLQYLDFR